MRPCPKVKVIASNKRRADDICEYLGWPTSYGTTDLRALEGRDNQLIIMEFAVTGTIPKSELAKMQHYNRIVVIRFSETLNAYEFIKE